jgi:hypothetical protein
MDAGLDSSGRLIPGLGIFEERYKNSKALSSQ